MVIESGGGNNMVKHKLNLANFIIAKSRFCKRKNLKSQHIKPTRPKKIRYKRNIRKIGYTVDVPDLLFTKERDFLLKNNGQKVRVDDLKGKTIVLYLVPMEEGCFGCIKPGETQDMIEAYNELMPLGGIEFVFVPVHLHYLHPCILEPFEYDYVQGSFDSEEGFFNHLFSALPWPAVPFSDVAACGDRVVETFWVDYPLMPLSNIPYWVIIDPTGTVVATRARYPTLFKLFGGAELHPMSRLRIEDLWAEHIYPTRSESRERLISDWDQLLAAPTRDFLLSSNGDKVLISSLKGKVIGLYFCENIPNPPHMDMINKVYQEAKLCGYDFEIVQINFHYHFFSAYSFRAEDCSVRQHCQNINWLTLPFKDPSCRKLQRILKCDIMHEWNGDCFVIVDPREAEVLFEFSGVEIFQHYGIQGYPFTRKHLFKTEYRIQKKELRLQLLFPLGKCHLSRPAGDGFDLTNASQLSGKRVIVLFANQSECKPGEFVSMLESKYREQLHDAAEENKKFEVVYVSTDRSESIFTECIKDMPWLVHPYSEDFAKWCSCEIFKVCDQGVRVAAFDIDGKIIAKQSFLDTLEMHRFPFVSRDLVRTIQWEVQDVCRLDVHFF